MSVNCGRRSFLKSTAALSALGLWLNSNAAANSGGGAAVPALLAVPRKKKPAIVRGAFFYPPPEIVLAGECEDSWSREKWFTWPGNQFGPEEQHLKFKRQLERIAEPLDVSLVIDDGPIYTDAGIQRFIADVQASKPDALLLFNFWNSFSAKVAPILDAYDGPIIVYHPVGSNHQLPPEKFRTAPRVQYIHSIENWDALERGLRAVHAKSRMAQSRLLRVSGRIDREVDAEESFFGMPIHGVPADHFNGVFDETPVTDEMRKLAETVRACALRVTDLDEEAFLDSARAHAAVLKLMEHHEADAITIECLFLKHRKPCLSFAINNGLLVPCGCENDLAATLTLMLGANLFGRGGFQHNPEFDTEENLYFGAHCTCTLQLHGPGGHDAPYELRPFFHQLPKTMALDVKWPAGEVVTLCKYHPEGSRHHAEGSRIDAWVGDVVSSPECPPTGGCATRVLVKIRDVKDVCDIYGGPHPILYCGDFGRQLKAFARLYGLEIRTNC